LSEKDPVDPHLEDGHRETAARFRAFGEQHLRAVARDEDDPIARAGEIGALLGDARLLESAVPPPFGSTSARAALVARETLAYYSLLAEIVFSAQALAARLLDAAGTEIQRRRWLPALAEGSSLATVALAEPAAGSDLGAVRCVAGEEGPLWRLTGTKGWVSLAGCAGLYVVLARDPESEGAEGLSLFLVDEGSPGLTVHPVEAIAALPVGELRLDGTPGVRLGEGDRALQQIDRSLAVLRPGAAGAACGLATRAVDEAVRHVLARRQFGQSLAAFQAIQMTLARLHADTEAARRLARHAAWLTDAGAEEAPRAAAAARVVADQAAGGAVDGALQLHGAQGLVRGSTVERLFREARALRLREGTSELVQLELAEALLKESR
jgi:alkylation response protein AidB-like acyl-CoA dehydrogenase